MISCRWTDPFGRELVWTANWARWCTAAVDSLLEARQRFRDDCGPYQAGIPPLRLQVRLGQTWLDTGFVAPERQELDSDDLKLAFWRTMTRLQPI